MSAAWSPPPPYSDAAAREVAAVALANQHTMSVATPIDYHRADIVFAALESAGYLLVKPGDLSAPPVPDDRGVLEARRDALLVEGMRALIARAEAFLVPCGYHDAGLLRACACPPGDQRTVIYELAALAALSETWDQIHEELCVAENGTEHWAANPADCDGGCPACAITSALALLPHLNRVAEKP